MIVTARPAWTEPYLAKLGIADPDGPSLEVLRALHRAHVERVAFENIDIQLGRPQGIDPDESIARILAGRGGYCFNLNGAFAELLEVLGFDVTRHRGQINGAAESAKASASEFGTHFALTVMLGGELWSVDVGLANGHHEPIPLTVGVHRQGPFAFELATLPDVGEDVWRFFTDPAQKTYHSMDFTLAPATWTDFTSYHVTLSTSPLSGFVKTFELFRRDAAGTDYVLGDVLFRDEGSGRRTEQTLTSVGELFEVATDLFHLDLSGIDAADRARLWERIQVAQEERRAAASAATAAA